MFREARIEKFTTDNKPPTKEIVSLPFVLSGSFVYFHRSKSTCKIEFTRDFIFACRGTPLYHVKKKKNVSGSCICYSAVVRLYNCLHIVKERLFTFFSFLNNQLIITNHNSSRKSKMANITVAAQFTELEERVKVLRENLDQMFLLVMGCFIFCEYVFFVIMFFTLVIFS